MILASVVCVSISNGDGARFSASKFSVLFGY